MFRAGVIPLLVRRQPAGDAQGLRLTPTLISTTAVATSLFQRRKPRGPESNRPPRGHSLSVAKLGSEVPRRHLRKVVTTLTQRWPQCGSDPTRVTQVT